MGFLRFLGKKEATKGVDLDKEIDLPPLPSSFREDLPDFPMEKEEEPRGPMFPKPIEEKEPRMPLPPLEPLPFPGIVPPPVPKHPLEVEPMPMPPPMPVHEERFIPKPLPITHPEPVMRHEMRPIHRRIYHEARAVAPAVHATHIIRDGALFLKMEQYREFMYDLESIKDLLKKTDGILKKINSVKNEEDIAIEEWHKMVEDLNKKIILVDKAMAR